VEARLAAGPPVKYYVTIEDRVVEVEVTDTPAGTTATIEGRTFAVDLLPVSADELFSLVVDSQSHEVLVEDVADGIEVIVGGELFRIVVQDEWERRLASIQRKTAAVTGETIVKAPMPGQVIGVPVQTGNPIKTGQPLVILSAMKMENEIRSPRDGVIVAVHVSHGDKAEQGAPLVTIGPAA
jgi:acetyl/propionyl-CoA carboxylase alpha subunit